MPHDEDLARRIRPLLPPATVEKRMFGGVAFMVGGNMSVGVHRDELVVRIDPGETDEALAVPGVRTFDITGRPMKGWLMVSPAALESGSELAAWVARGVAYARALPRK